MASKKMMLLIALCASMGFVHCQTPSANLQNLKLRLLQCEGMHICDVLVTTISNSVTCIAKELLCDGTNNCPSGSDEMNCSRCLANEVLCRDTYTCAKVCDGIKQCKTGEDEAACPVKCPHGEMQCIDQRTCAKVCNSISECPNGADELGCPKKCPPGQMLCSDLTTCAKPCDGATTCPNGGADEAGCPSQCQCNKGQYICSTGDKCLNRDALCEGAMDMVATSCTAVPGTGDDEDDVTFGFGCNS